MPLSSADLHANTAKANGYPVEQYVAEAEATTKLIRTMSPACRAAYLKEVWPRPPRTYAWLRHAHHLRPLAIPGCPQPWDLAKASARCEGDMHVDYASAWSNCIWVIGMKASSNVPCTFDGLTDADVAHVRTIEFRTKPSPKIEKSLRFRLSLTAEEGLVTSTDWDPVYDEGTDFGWHVRKLLGIDVRVAFTEARLAEMKAEVEGKEWTVRELERLVAFLREDIARTAWKLDRVGEEMGGLVESETE